MESWCVRVDASRAEFVRKKLLQLGLLDRSLKVARSRGDVLFPIISERLADLPDNLKEKIETADFEERMSREGNYKQYVKIPQSLVPLLPSSFDIIGDIAVIKLPDELLPYKAEIGEALIMAFPNIKAVALDKGIRGDRRIMDLEIIAGEKRTETVHTEYGLRFKVDIKRTYFNPRLASERRRIASLVTNGEIIIDMFAGVGPFSLMIRKYGMPRIIYAIDFNTDAIDYLRKNIVINRLDRIVPICAEARVAIEDLPPADRIVMNLPHSTGEFIMTALNKLEEGGILHTYFISAKSKEYTFVEWVKCECTKAGISIDLLRCEELKSYSPAASVYSLDLLLFKRS
ncbi:MAG: class I SAM-dependent methyltransferase family protein [Methanomassiliicoccales archaeon]|nr:class I SAM-dependent methyltransferase family protein [Methanomassiliicoccales archaeon]